MFTQKRLSQRIHTAILCCILSMIFSSHAAADTLIEGSDIRVNLGVKSMVLSIGDVIPWPLTATIDWDLGRYFRAHAKMGDGAEIVTNLS